MQSYIVLNCFSLPIFGFALVFTMLGCLLHGIAGATGLSNFLPAFLRISEFSLSSGCPFLFFSILSGFTSFRPNFWTHMIGTGGRSNFGQSLTGPHVSFWRFPLSVE